MNCKHEFIKLMFKTLETVGGVSKKVLNYFISLHFLPLKCVQAHVRMCIRVRARIWKKHDFDKYEFYLLAVRLKGNFEDIF